MVMIISEKKGTWFAVCSGLLYGLLGYFGMSIMETGFSVYNLSFWRFSIALLFLIAITAHQTPKMSRSLSQYLHVLINGAIFYSAPSTLYFIASEYVGTGQAMVIFFTYPFFVMLLNWLLEKRPIQPHYFLSFILILFGLVLLVDLGNIAFDFVGIGLSLVSSFAYAIYIFVSKRAALPPLPSTMMVSLGCAVTAGIFALFDGSLRWPTHLQQWLYIVGIGIICTALPILLLLEAMKHISSDKASLLSVLEPVFTVFFGVLLLGEVISLSASIGIILTLFGAMIVTVRWRMFVLSPKKILPKRNQRNGTR
jgi:drug/metabolite transporter (DMT)-like permease